MARYSLILQGFQFKVVHVKGLLNSAADCLSRRTYLLSSDNITDDIQKFPDNQILGRPSPDLSAHLSLSSEEGRVTSTANSILTSTVTPSTRRIVTFATPLAQIIPDYANLRSHTSEERPQPSDTSSSDNNITSQALSSSDTSSSDSDSQSSDPESLHDSETDASDSDSELSVVESDISFDDDVYVLASETASILPSDELPTTQSTEFLTAAVVPIASTSNEFLPTNPKRC